MPALFLPLPEIGTGRLTLIGANTYAGGTIVNQGTLLVDNTSGSGTGTGEVTVNAGTLGGDGVLAGPVTVGTGSGPASLSPGAKGKDDIGLLTIQAALTFGSQGSYQFQLDSDNLTADGLSASGVTIGSSTHFTTKDFGSAGVASGTTFLVINNTAATPISGTFSNLPMAES